MDSSNKLTVSKNLFEAQSLPSLAELKPDSIVGEDIDILIIAKESGLTYRSKLSGRHCLVTGDGRFVVYKTDNRGYVVDISNAFQLVVATPATEGRNEKKNDCEIGLLYSFGCISLFIGKESMTAWRNAIESFNYGYKLTNPSHLQGMDKPKPNGLKPRKNRLEKQRLPSMSELTETSSAFSGEIWCNLDPKLSFASCKTFDERKAVLTKDGYMVIYMRDKKGYVLDLHRANSVIFYACNGDRANTVCAIELKYSFGWIRLKMHGRETMKDWRNALDPYLYGDKKVPGIKDVPAKAPSVPVTKDPALKKNGETGTMAGFFTKMVNWMKK